MTSIKLSLIIILLGPCGNYAISQEQQQLVVKGEVRDSINREPLPFVHVRIKGKAIGVPTNSEGQFAVHLSQDVINDSLIISSMGYTSKLVPVKHLLEKGHSTFLLSQKAIQLEAVVITGLDVENIIREVSKRLNQTFPTDSYDFDGFYRNSYREGSKYVRQLEMAFTGFDGKFHNRSGHSVGLLKKTESQDFRRFKWKQATGNIPWHYLWRTRRQHRHFFTGKQHLKYDYSIDDNTYFDGEEVYKLKFVLKDSSERVRNSWAFIRAKDYAIVEIGGNWKLVNPKKIQLGDSLSMTYTGGSTVVKYVAYEGKMYPSYSRSLYQHEAYDVHSNHLGSFDMDEELIIHEIKSPSTYGSKKSFERMQRTKNATLAADSLFWKQYNQPVETALSRAIKRDLEEQKKSAKD